MTTTCTKPELIPLLVWDNGHKDRPLAVYGPCPCGCSPNWMLSGSNAEGDGITIELPSEETARDVAARLSLEIVEG